MYLTEPTFDYKDSRIKPIINGRIMYLSRKGFHTLKIMSLVLVLSKQIKHNTDKFFEQWRTPMYRMFIMGSIGIGFGFIR